MTSIILLFYNNLIFFILLITLFFSVSVFYINYRKYYYRKFKFDNSPKAQQEFLKYLDQYYINNKAYSFIAIIIYLFFQSGWIITYRLFLIYSEKKSTITFPIEYEIKSLDIVEILYNVAFAALLFITIMSFKIMIEVLFKYEVSKIHLFLLSNRLYAKIKVNIALYYPFQEFFGKCYAFFFTISRLQETYMDPEEDNLYLFHYENRFIYENQFILTITKNLVLLAKNSKIFHYIINRLTQLFKWLHYNMIFKGFAYYIPYIFLMSIIFYSFTSLNNNYNNYLFISAFFFIQLLHYMKFIEKRDAMDDGRISRYFYKNSLDYKTQRLLLKTDIYKFHDNMYNSKEGKILLDSLAFFNKPVISITDYIFNDCTNHIVRDKENQEYTKEFRASHKRYYIFSILAICTYYIITNAENYSIILNNFGNKEISILYLIIPLMMFTLYCARKIYISPRDNYNGYLSEYIYRKEYKVIFWILVMCLIYLFVLLIIKANVFLINDGIIWNHWGVEMIRNYTIEFKKEYFYDHLYNILMQFKGQENGEYHINRLLYIVNELKWERFIIENTTIAEVKELVEIFVRSYLEKYTAHMEEIKNIQLIRQEQIMLVKSVMDCVSNITNLIVFSSFLNMYIKAWHIVANPRSYETGKLIISALNYLNYLFRK